MVQTAKHHVTLTDLEAKVSAFGKHLDAVTTELRDLRHILVEAEIIRPDEPPAPPAVPETLMLPRFITDGAARS